MAERRRPKISIKIPISTPDKEKAEEKEHVIDPPNELGLAHPDLERSTVLKTKVGQIEVKLEDLKTIRELGRGSYGVVELREHVPTKFRMAVKIIRFSGLTEDRKRALNDLRISIQAKNCKYLIDSYGALHGEGDLMICMEVLDSSLDKVINAMRDVMHESFEEATIGKVAFATITALHYLKTNLHVMHRDVKPSNILIRRNGDIKLCDFGIAGMLVQSLAKTQKIGCRLYMAPERLDESHSQTGFDVRSDVWSLGLTVLELAALNHPYRSQTVFEQLKHIEFAFTYVGPKTRLFR